MTPEELKQQYYAQKEELKSTLKEMGGYSAFTHTELETLLDDFEVNRGEAQMAWNTQNLREAYKDAH